MSVNDDKVDPEGSVLWWWFNKNHKHSKIATKRDFIHAINRFERFLAVKGGYDFEGDWTDIDLDDVPSDKMIEPRDVDDELVEDFLRNFLAPDYAPGTQQGTASRLSKIYDECVSKTLPIEDDVFGYVLEENKDILDDTTSRNPYIIDIDDAREFISDWDHPLFLAVNLFLAKTCRRIGGVLNLDLQDINIDHPGCDWTVNSNVRHWPNHMVFRKDKEAKDDGRKDGNKTETTQVCPIDDELRDALIWYLTIRIGDWEPESPLFKGPQKADRLRSSLMNTKMQEKAEKFGHYYGANDDDNVNQHYWRHWATTTFEDRVGDAGGLVTYLRGDVGSTKDGYNSWTSEKERIYRENVPKFFMND